MKPVDVIAWCAIVNATVLGLQACESKDKPIRKVVMVAKMPGTCTAPGDCQGGVPVCADKNNFSCDEINPGQGFCNYQPAGSNGTLTCECYKGQVAWCYVQETSWRIGTKSCGKDPTGNYLWGPCNMLQ